MAEEALKHELLIIGGSAGSIDVLIKLVPEFPADFGLAIIIVVHRKAMDEDLLLSLLQKRSKMNIKGAEGNEPIQKGMVYIAPADYHLLVEEDKSIVLDYSDKVHYSRPSIDLAFQSAAEVYQNKLFGVLLTGANEDGAIGMKFIQNAGGRTLVQSLDSAMIMLMPQAADRLIKPDYIMGIEEMTHFLIDLDKVTAQ
ncbi:MAG: two-component system chemotaxis response regulator CheB [Crocinitomix sp.]|jgi:two-component system chemotaxis response regulator CheB